MSDAETTQSQQRGLVPWEKGKSGNPKGRPKGSRHKINELFLRDFYEAWEAFGRPALLAMAWTKPDKFVECASSLLPKEFKIETTVTEMTDEQLQSRIRRLADDLRDEIGGLAGAGNAPRGTEAPQGSDKAPPVSAVH